MSLVSANLNKTYSFETRAGARYKNFKFVAILDAGTVIAMGVDVPALHQQNIPYLPPGSPSSYLDYTYAKFINADGEMLYLAIPWIKQESMVENNAPGYRITVPTATSQQLNSVRSMMVAAGIETFTIDPI